MTETDTERRAVTMGSENVFADLGVAEPVEALLKADLAIALTRLIADRNWTRRQAGEVLQIDQPTVSDLIRGQLGGFSVERLLRLLNLAGQDVTVMVSPVASAGAIGRSQVIGSGSSRSALPGHE